MFPETVILDPELTDSTPIKQTPISDADVVSHLMEGHINHNDPWVPMQDRIAQGMIKTVMDCMEILLERPEDPQARTTIKWVSTYTWFGGGSKRITKRWSWKF